MSGFINLEGKKFSRLKVLKRAGTINGNASWLCVCKCGNRKIIASYKLLTKNTKSCGCLQSESRKKHGDSGTRFYKIWRNIFSRCNLKTTSYYHYYGGRGIKLRWKSYEQFKKDMKKSYEHHVKQFGIKNTTIDRKDTNGSYSKTNCRWATPKEQARNTRRTAFVFYKGRKTTLGALANSHGLKYSQVFRRVHKSGWDLEKALTTPIK